MRCQKCGVNNANVNYTSIFNGYRKELHLCSECAREMNLGVDFELENRFLDFFNEFSNMRRITIPDFAGFSELENGLGDFFSNNFFSSMPFFSNGYLHGGREESLDKVLNNIQKKYKENKITDENKNSKFEFNKKENEIMQLKTKMQEYIKNEEYEKAAVLRDKIKEIEGKNK